MVTIERTSIVVPSKNTSSAAFNSASETDSSWNATPAAAASRRLNCRVIPGKMGGPSGVPASFRPRTHRTEECVASVTRPSDPTRTDS